MHHRRGLRTHQSRRWISPTAKGSASSRTRGPSRRASSRWAASARRSRAWRVSPSSRDSNHQRVLDICRSLVSIPLWQVFFALVIITGLALGGMAIYRAGFTHGAMTNLTIPEGAEYPLMPYRHMPYGRGIGPRVGLMGLFPLLCFGGFFFLLLIGGIGFGARKRAWMHHYGPGACPPYGKHHGPPPPWWGGSSFNGRNFSPNVNVRKKAPKTPQISKISIYAGR